MFEKSVRLVTDANDTIVMSQRDNGAFYVEIMLENKNKYFAVYLTENDIDVIRRTIHNELDSK